MYKNSGRKQHFRAALESPHLAGLGEHPAQAPWFFCLLLRIIDIHHSFNDLPLTIRLRISCKSVNWRSSKNEWLLLDFLLLFLLSFRSFVSWTTLPWAKLFFLMLSPLLFSFPHPTSLSHYSFCLGNSYPSLKILFKDHLLCGGLPDPHWQLITNIPPFFHTKELCPNNQIDIICLLICPHTRQWTWQGRTDIWWINKLIDKWIIEYTVCPPRIYNLWGRQIWQQTAK